MDPRTNRIHWKSGELGAVAKWYALALLTLTYVLNFMDRYAIVAMAEFIKQDLNLSDAQLGLLTGFAFSLVYAVMGLPIAILADRVGRVRIISASVALWSAMTALGSLAGSFLALAASRFGVGVGEAGGTPPAHAIISQTFSGRSLPMALGIYSTGSGIGLALGLSLGGVLAAEIGWRNALIVLGLPGIAVAALVLFTVREPKKAEGQAQPKLEELPNAVSEVLGDQRLLRLALAMSTAAFAGFANLAWLSPLAIRRFGIDGGTTFALSQGIGLANIAGIFLGGVLAASFKAGDRRSAYLICTFAVLVAVPAFMMAYLTDAPLVFILSASLGIFVHSLILAPVVTETQLLSRPEHKALTSAIMIFCINIFGAGAGAFAVGVMSDSLGHLGAERALTFGLMASLVSYFVSALVFFRSRPPRPLEPA